MKSFTAHIKRVSLAVVALSSVVAVPSAFAAIGETNAGVTIDNSAKVDYQVSGVGQPQITSPTASFTVDRKVLFTVSEVSGTATTVTPGEVNKVTVFRVSNTGNAAEGFQLTAANQSPAGGTLFTKVDNQNMLNIRAFLDVNNNGTYEPLTDIATSINSIPRDESRLVFVLADTDNTFTNSQYANVTLTARAAVAGTSGATLEVNSATDNVGGAPDVVIGVAGNTASDADQYAIQSAALTVTKTSAVIADLINCPTGPSSCGANVPKAIPGATIRYTIAVTNGGAEAATSVTLTDAIPGNTKYVNNSMTLNSVALTDSADTDGGTTTGLPVTSVSVVAGSLATTGPTATATVTFDVTVN